MNRKAWIHAFARALPCFSICCLAAGSLFAQVSPTEIKNAKLSATEQQYFPQLQSLQHAIGETKFPLPFILTRYVGVDPSRQTSLDTRGLEFVYFQSRMLMKTSGFYTAAFNADQLTSNERAGRIFQEVIVPILRLIAEQIPSNVACDGIGFEIAYHTRATRKNSDYEGREILVVVFDRADAFAFLNDPGKERQQAILNRSEIYLDGKPFGLAPGKKEALNLEALEGSGPAEAGPASAPAYPAAARQPLASPRFAPAASSSPSRTASRERDANTSVDRTLPPEEPKPAPSQADVDRLQGEYQSQLDALLKQNGAQFQLVDYAPPSFAIYRRQLVLQFTLRSPLSFERGTSSIYKRAAQSFDLFLAPQLKALVPKLPVDREIDALDFSILNHVTSEKDASEAVEFVCPLKSIRSFVEDEISSQDLIDQSVVLVNGVRINLHLELVE